MHRLIHLSDLHFGATDAEVPDLLLDGIRQCQPDVVVVTGDLTQRARVEQFKQARAFLQALPCPYVVVPGNHDIAPVYRPLARVWWPLARYHHYIHPHRTMVYVNDELLIVGLDTVARLRWKEGRTPSSQLGWFRRVCAEHPNRRIIVASHHPLVDHSGRTPASLSKLLSALTDNHVQVCLSGHLHRTYSGIQADLVARRSMLVIHASTASSHRLRGQPNSFNELLVEADRVSTVVHELNAGRFSAAASAVFHWTGQRWVQAAEACGGNQ